MAFFDDLFDSITGQQATPQQTIIPTSDLLGQAYATAIGQAPNVIAYNQALAPGLTNVQLGVERQYDPNIAALRAATSRSILDNLNLGGALDPELQNMVITNALEGNAATGFGVSQGGRGLVARDLGLTSLDLARQRRQEALGAVRSSPSLDSLFRTDRGITPDVVASDIRSVQAARDELANLTEDIRRQNFSSLLNTGGRIAGTVIGGVFGGGMGAQLGGQVGGSLITGSRVAGQQRQTSSGGGGLGSILNGLMSGGGGQFGGGYAGGVMMT